MGRLGGLGKEKGSGCEEFIFIFVQCCLWIAIVEGGGRGGYMKRNAMS